MLVIVADVGGTWSRLRLLDLDSDAARHVIQRQYANAEYPNLTQVLEHFMEEADAPAGVAHLALALAGPVFGRNCHLTNLPWHVDADELASHFSIPAVHLLNDLYAAALGLGSLKSSDKCVIQTQDVAISGPALLIGVGTGLGQAMLVEDSQSKQVFESEVGFTGFAPDSEFDIGLLRYARERESYVSNETFVSASGLGLIYRFLLESHGEPCAFPVTAKVVTQKAMLGDARAREAMRRFSAILGSYCGNAVLSCLASSGVYLMGGMARAVMDAPGEASFLASFKDKGLMSGYMQSVPVTIVTSDDLGLLGVASWLRDIQSGSEFILPVKKR